MTRGSAHHVETPGSVLPLRDRRVAVTRAREQSKELAEQLQSLGAKVIECPAIAIAPPDSYSPVDEAVTELRTYDWVIFTSVNAVEAFAARVAQVSESAAVLAGRKICAVGPATADALRKLDIEPTFVPSSYLAEAIIAEIGDIEDLKILLPAADIARKTLADGLRLKGAHVDEVTVYRTVAGEGSERLADLLRNSRLDAVTFTSSSTVRNTIENLATCIEANEDAVQLMNRAKIVCIGPVTAGTARELGVRVDAVALEHTTAGLVAALVALFAADRKRDRGAKGTEGTERAQGVEHNA